MSNMFVITKKQLRLVGLGLILIVLVYSFWMWNQSNTAASSAEQPRIIHMVIGEFSSTTKKGQEIEVYRWDPGTIAVKEGESIELRILGVNGEHHSFVIEGLNVKGEVHKGKETVVHFVAEEEGTYRIICINHSDLAHQGPMIGYIVVN
ncbi:MAG: cupredoxin domain-containing protein [Paenibacillaceae bacterium]